MEGREAAIRHFSLFTFHLSLKRKAPLFFFTLLFPAWLVAQVHIAVSIVPEATFVRKIAGDLADVTVMVPPGASPASYEPKPSQMRAIANADLYFAIGVPFERAWLPRFARQNRRMRIVDVTEGIQKVPMASHHHHHDLHHNHDHTQHSTLNTQHSLDPHVWLAPPLVKRIARNIVDALVQADPAHKTAYRRNLEAFELEIDATDRRLRTILAPCKGQAMMVFHPSWGYFARTYGLRQIPIEIEGKEPKAKELAHLIHEAKEEGVRSLFVQPQFSQRAARIIAEAIGATLVIADPMASDWSENLIDVAQKVCGAKR